MAERVIGKGYGTGSLRYSTVVIKVLSQVRQVVVCELPKHVST